MTSLNIQIEGDFKCATPYVVKLEKMGNFIIENDRVKVSTEYGQVTFSTKDLDEIDGNICIIFPEKKRLIRQIRPQANSNTILLTEQCDQACVMCSQPPKNKVYDYYQLYEEAILLSPKGLTIGISGGEPTLERERLFNFLLTMKDKRPDIKFHVLTNAQHFIPSDIPILDELAPTVVWGVPLYSSEADVHDEIVGKSGAHKGLLNSINILLQAGVNIELRTVVMQQNFQNLPKLADFIARHLSLCDVWALMQLENIGFAKMNWSHIFIDTSTNFSPLANALAIAITGQIKVALYNFPLCSVPSEWRTLCCKSISDWKNKYLEMCNSCSSVSECCGFFSWYNEQTGFEGLKTL